MKVLVDEISKIVHVNRKGGSIVKSFFREKPSWRFIFHVKTAIHRLPIHLAENPEALIST